ncbi:MAG TPA: hypothetical protein VE685_16255 [Thermoanaerobaculia bacterium]|nr:hypothetical protein [Thermoanaerobaculia bacterium]
MKTALRYSVPLVLGLVLGTGLIAPQPAVEAAICPEIGCVNDQYCRRDRDCTAAPGGVCNLFCATRGCCSYPAP